MADNVVSVEFGAKTDAIDKGAAQVSDKLKQLQDQTNDMASQFQAAGDTISASMSKAAGSMKELEDGFSSAIEVLKKGSLSESTLLKFLLGGAIGGAAAEAVKSVRDMGDEFDELEKHAREATLTMQQYAALQKAVKDDVDAAQFAAGIEAAANKWNDLNHGVSETKKLLEANNVSWKDQTGQIISFNDYIMKSAALIQNARTEVDKFKIGELLGFSREWVRALQDGPEELKKATAEAEKTNAEHLKLIAKAHQFSEEWKTATQDWGDKFKAIMVELFPYIEQFVNLMLNGISAWVTILGQARTPALVESISAAEHAANRARNSMQGVSEQFEAATGSASRFRDVFGAFSAGVPSVQAQFKSIVDDMSPLPKVWQEVYNEITASDAAIKKLGEEDFFSKSGTSIPVKEQFDKTALREFEAELDKVKEKYQEQKVIEQTLVDTFKETESEKVAHLKAALADRETATNAILAEELMKYGDNAAQRARIELQAQKLIHEAQLEGLKLQEDVLKKSAQEWQSVLSTISGAFTSQLRGILQGTTTWSQAIKNIMLDLVLKIIDEFLKLAIIKPLSGMLASALEAPSEIFADIIKVIKNMFGPLMAGFTSFFAPVQGPAAPAEGAALASATVATAVGAVALDTGTDYVPRTGLALIHQGEAIIPAGLNPFTGGGALASPTINFSVQAWDAQSVQNWLRAGGGATAIAKLVAKMMNQNPTLRPSY